jgi:transposase-like protein/IS1 family transposase
LIFGLSPQEIKGKPPMTCKRCHHDTARKFGSYGKRHIQRYRCSDCRATFSEPAPKLGTHYTDPEAAAKALAMMLEGMSVRAISRLTGLHKDTILGLMNTGADSAARVLDRIRNIHPEHLQCDEIWCFVGKKQKQVRKGDPAELGDQWVFVAIDAETKLIPCFALGKRTRETTVRFISDLQERLTDERFQLTTDGFHFYERAVENIFAGQADFAQLIKLYGDYGQHGTERYSPSPIVEVISKVRDGRPDPAHISTSFIERSNLSLRMGLRRFTRLTNAYSKKLANLQAALTLWFAFYNFCRVHTTLRVTPAMQAGLTDHIWTVAELLGAA